MAMPKFKPTKWKLEECASCKKWPTYNCRNHEDHMIVERDNVPFRIPDMKIITMGSKWTKLKSEKLNRTYNLHFTQLGRLVMNGVEKGGGLPPNQWWMYEKSYGFSLKWMGSDE